MKTRNLYNCWIAALLFAIFAITAFADQPQGDQPQADQSVTEPTVSEQSLIHSLKSIDQSITRLKNTLKEQQQLLSSPASKGREDEINSDIRRTSEEINLLQSNFRQLAANVDLDQLTDVKDDKQFSLVDELAKLIKPLLSKLESITALPREIENLRSDAEKYQQRLVIITKAEKNIKNLLNNKGLDKDISARLSKTKDFWDQQAKSVATDLTIIDQKLKSRLAEQTPLGESLSNVFQIFFKTRGRNIALAFLFSALFFLLLQKLFHITQNSARLKQRRFSNYNKLILLLYILLSGIGTALTFIAVLYLSGDWLLLTLALLLLLGLAWASRETLPRFWSQLVLLLNMGPVREGELITLNGLLWKVEKLNLYAQLINPALNPARIKVPVVDLLALRSREAAKDECFFPTNHGDWVLMVDGKLGQVVLQTPTLVQIAQKGGAIRSFPATSFSEQGITNLSKGFRVGTSFGLDYKHQTEITEKIPSQLKTFIMDQLVERGYETKRLKSAFEFKEAASSSLNVAVLLDFPGELAGDHEVLERLIQRLCVDACNKFAWTIPFEQLTLHVQQE